MRPSLSSNIVMCVIYCNPFVGQPCGPYSTNLNQHLVSVFFLLLINKGIYWYEIVCNTSTNYKTIGQYLEIVFLPWHTKLTLNVNISLRKSYYTKRMKTIFLRKQNLVTRNVICNILWKSFRKSNTQQSIGFHPLEIKNKLLNIKLLRSTLYREIMFDLPTLF